MSCMEPLQEPRAAGHKVRRALRRMRGALLRLARVPPPHMTNTDCDYSQGHSPRQTKASPNVEEAQGQLQLQSTSSPRRQRLDNADCGPGTVPATPQRRRQVLGRTPTKLYSPFGIETPRYPAENLNESIYYPDTPEHGASPVRKHFKSKSHVWRLINTRPRSLFQ